MSCYRPLLRRDDFLHAPRVNWGITQDAKTLLPSKQDLPIDTLLFAGEVDQTLNVYLPAIVDEVAE